MAENNESSDPQLPSAQEMQGWLEREISAVGKMVELRLKQATRIVNAYVRGELSADETAQRVSDYSDRWGEALPGVASSRGMTDEQVLEIIDQTHATMARFGGRRSKLASEIRDRGPSF